MEGSGDGLFGDVILKFTWRNWKITRTASR